jgi:hypothetical protein
MPRMCGQQPTKSVDMTEKTHVSMPFLLILSISMYVTVLESNREREKERKREKKETTSDLRSSEKISNVERNDGVRISKSCY